MSDIERVPSMRKDAKQGVPKKPNRAMARPVGEAKPEKKAKADMPEPIETLPSLPKTETEPEPQVEQQAEPVVVAQADPTPEAAPEPEPEVVMSEPTPDLEPEPEPEAVPPAEPRAQSTATIKELLRRVEGEWANFKAMAARFPWERMDEHLSEDSWTRKQMLAHVAAWHDLTADRLVKFFLTGQPVVLDRETDAINASVARQAIGKTAGEVMKDMEMTFNRLHRQMQRLSDAQLRANDGWAAWVIGANTFEHYAEHVADLYMPEPAPGSSSRR